MEMFYHNPTSYILTRWLFLRALGIIYFIAFTSLSVQVSGLIGKKGILPVGRYLQAVRNALGRKGYVEYPSLAWIDSSDRALNFFCLAGMLLSILLFFGVQTTPVLFFCWALYLSFVTVGQVFLSYQWDALLLEAGFLSIFLVPPSIFPGQAAAAPSPLVIFLLRWLLFRLMFMSGIMKIASHAPTWRNFTALQYHYETQPLPTPLAWYMYRLPLWFQKLSTLFALFVEIAIPFLFFGPDVIRVVGGILTILLQLLILLTGNFAFFNILTIALTIPLFYEGLIRDAFQGSILSLILPQTAPTTHTAWGNILIIPITAVLVITSLLFIYNRLNQKALLSPFGQKVLIPWMQIAAAFRLVNSYGLFTVMTIQRPEISIEGSLDGENWLPYEFKYIPGDPKRRPPIVAPHQPRLDWQMWFAALGTYNDNPWLLHFVERLLDDSPHVIDLMEKNPFPEKPPKYIRAWLYDYHFSSPAEKAQNGSWWRREELGLYLPPVSLEK
jgi:hypothetical protein